MSIIEKNPIILVDGSFYMYRVYHAFPPLTTSCGNPIWVIYGMIKILRSLLIQYQPTHMSIIFDTPGKTFRNDLFEQYKANRIKMPENLCVQIHPLHEIIRAMGIPILNIPHVEADDVIGTLAIFYAQLGKTVLISTGDKDMTQIVSSKITLINTISNVSLNPIEVKKKFGVPPTLIADYLALIGDRTDNIPGVSGIGKKTAQVLLNKIGNLEKIYQNLNNILTLSIRGVQKIYKLLITNKEIAFLSYKLTIIKTDVPLKKADYILSIQKIDFYNLLFLFKKYEFTIWLEELYKGIWLYKNKYLNKTSLNNQIHDIQSNCIENLEHKKFNIKREINCTIIYDIQALYNWIEKNKIGEYITINIQTNTDNINKAKIISLCISVCLQENVYIPITTDISNNYNDNNNNLYIESILLILKPILENPKIKKIGQNMKFNYALLKNYNINLVGMIFDVILEFYVLYSTINYQSIKRFLDKITCDVILNFKETYNHYNKNIINSKERNIQLESLYASTLISNIFKLHQVLWSKIKENSKLKKIFEEIEIPLISILSQIENYGVLIDRNLLNIYAIELNARLKILETEVYQLTNTSFNIASTKQLQKILYDKQKLPIIKKTPTGAPSTNEEVLKKLAKHCLIPKIILQYRGLSKLKSMYVNKLISMTNKKSNRVHTSYNQIRTSTGRLSSANPNLQNIPNRNRDGRKIRQAFIAPSNSLIVSADYSQIELRIMAHLSHDTKMIHDFLSGKDIHLITASEIFVTESHLITHEQRHHAKTINFGLIYGMSAFGLAQQLSITCKDAQKYVDRYFQRYPDVMKYMQYIKDHVNKYGYVSTLDGRKLYLPDIYSANVSKRKGAERAAINAPMQGSAADITKKAMVSINHWLKKNNIPMHIIMQVHDELVFEIQSNFLDIAIKQIKKIMEECYLLDVPLKVEIGVGKNWEQAH